MDKKCVNGNCPLRHCCGRYHQAKNVFEARGANGLFERYSCRKGKCEHFANVCPNGGAIHPDFKAIS